VLSSFSPAETAAWDQAFRQGLRDLGWEAGLGLRWGYGPPAP